MASVQLTDDAREDLLGLDGSARKIVLKTLLKLEDQPESRGQPLGSRKTGNLTGLRKLVVGDRDYRIVYRVEDDGTVWVIWVIGRRADDEVYALALARLKNQATMPSTDET
ncbi:type II toxin-antitoxin system RelE/ParE family toxin [Arthrobacter echini]|uniref:Type II toxin-antitoxin system RelE/ParE family toxin n=1 Tax=Arthrobacter echini TaxID=1529066 RepID=A0A4S5E9P4_9MICC|nr:type II toxin-antitoxin system RelE/ParE family toxin [Arthrobacter echini]THJ68436.1 type II toxin-antitoxin system RelE/ParE family toxin [Arthrobacter echini]